MSLTTLSPWQLMWALAVAIFAACKCLTWQNPSINRWRNVAYFAAWPGLDAAAFLNPSPLVRRPSASEWAFAFSKLFFGIAVTWSVVRLVPIELPVLRGWVGMMGLIFLMHFGAFHLLSCAWRQFGVDAQPIMKWPVLSTSVGEFWGKRWNTAFRDMTFRFLFRPLCRRFGARAGLAAGFLFSGVIHDLVISVPAGGGYGLPTLYFVVQGMGILAERSIRLGNGWKGRLFAAVIVIAPAYFLFHPAFVLRVILPFLEVIGAC